jgi:hypothetical protein
VIRADSKDDAHRRNNSDGSAPPRGQFGANARRGTTIVRLEYASHGFGTRAP